MTADETNALIAIEVEKRSLAADTAKFEQGMLIEGWKLGERYAALKERVGHGNWEATLNDMGVPKTTSARYMRLFDGYPELGKSANLALLAANTQQRALEVLAIGDESLRAKVEQNHPVTEGEVKAARTRKQAAKAVERELKDDPQAQETLRALEQANAELARSAAEKESLQAEIAKLKGDRETANIQNRIADLQKQETAIRSNLEHLNQEREKIEEGTRLAINHKRAHKAAMKKLQDASIEIQEMLNDETETVPGKFIDPWYQLADNIEGLAHYIRNQVARAVRVDTSGNIMETRQ